MKKILTLTSIASVAAVLALLVACQTTGTSQAVVQKEALLSQSGFKVVTVKTPKQQQAVNGLAQTRCSAVKYNGTLYYVFPPPRRTGSTLETSPIQHIRRQSRRSRRAGRLSNSNKCCTEEAPL